uniref:Uncharacterized protein n=1 Tax=Arion vulgaris TaxID=1028688 RepID=A0A0B7A204_9EUPU
MGEFQTLEQVRELGVKNGQARQCTLLGREGRYTKQLLTWYGEQVDFELLQCRTEQAYEWPMFHSVD